MLNESDRQDIELMDQLMEATSVQEILELTSRLKWDCSTKKAQEFLQLITEEATTSSVPPEGKQKEGDLI